MLSVVVAGRRYLTMARIVVSHWTRRESLHASVKKSERALGLNLLAGLLLFTFFCTSSCS